MSKRWKIGLTALLALAVIAAVIALTYSEPADLSEVEDNIAADIERQTGENGVTVDCPDGIDWEAGQNFRCTAEASRGTTALVTVYMETDDGDYTWEMR